MTKLTTFSKALFLSLGLATTGCVSDAVQGGVVNKQDAVQHIEQNRARLQSLQVFDVGQLLLDVPQEAYNCYGPCASYADEISTATADSAVRLEQLASVAEAALGSVSPAAADCEPAAIESNLATLRNLKIVAIGELITVEPANNPSCYNLPCGEDIEAARVATCDNASELAAIAAAVRK